MGKEFCATLKTSFLLVCQDCRQDHQARAQVRLPHRYRRVFLRVQQYHEVTMSTLKHRETEAILQKSKTEIRRLATIKQRAVDCEIFQEWLAEFTDNLEETQASAVANTSQASDSERLRKVAPRNHSV